MFVNEKGPCDSRVKSNVPETIHKQISSDYIILRKNYKIDIYHPDYDSFEIIPSNKLAIVMPRSLRSMIPYISEIVFPLNARLVGRLVN